MKWQPILLISLLFLLPETLAQAPRRGGQDPFARKARTLSINNGNMETQTGYLVRSWVFSGGGGQGIDMGIQETASCEGKYSGVMRNLNERRRNTTLTMTQRISGPELAQNIGKQFKVSGCLKTEHVDFADVEIQGFGGRGTRIATMSLTKGGIRGSRGWKTFEVQITLPQGITQLSIQCVLKGWGTAYFDDFKIEAMDLGESEAAQPAIGELREILTRYVRSSGREEKKIREELDAFRNLPLDLFFQSMRRGFLPGQSKSQAPTRGRLSGKAGGGEYEIIFPSGYPGNKLWPAVIFIEEQKAPVRGKQVTKAQPDQVVLATLRVTPGASVPPRAGRELAEILRIEHQIDADRIAVAGMERSGRAAAEAALSSPNTFSGLVLLDPSQLPDHIYAANGSRLPIYLTLPADQRKQAQGFTNALQAARPGFKLQGAEAAGRKEYLPRNILSWATGNRRDPLPPDFEETIVSRDNPGSHWIEVTQFGSPPRSGGFARIKAQVTGNNVVDIEVEGVRAANLLIQPQVFDLGRPLVVRSGGRILYNGPIPSDFDLFLEGLKTGDYRRLQLGTVPLRF